MVPAAHRALRDVELAHGERAGAGVLEAHARLHDGRSGAVALLDSPLEGMHNPGLPHIVEASPGERRQLRIVRRENLLQPLETLCSGQLLDALVLCAEVLGGAESIEECRIVV